MTDVDRLTALSDALKKAIESQDVEAITDLCERENDFLLSLEPVNHNDATKQALKHFIHVHQEATEFIADVHAELRRQLFQSSKTRKGVTQYKGIKNAE